MEKTSFDNTDLELVYKNIFTCTSCDKKYGHDSDNPKYKLCPVCEFSQKPRGWRRKKNEKL